MTAGRGQRRGSMNVHAPSMRRLLLVISGVSSISGIAVLPPDASAGPAQNPAHAIAEKFSQASEPAAQPPQRDSSSSKKRTAGAEPADEAELRAAQQQRSYEEEMLARARAEAEERNKIDLAREQAAVLKRAEEAKKNLERQRAEALANAEAQRAEEERKEAAKAAEAQAAEQRKAEQLTQQREHEARRLTERLRAARRAHEDEQARRNAEAEAATRAAADRAAADKAAADRDAAQRALVQAHDRLRNRTSRVAAKVEEARHSRLLAARDTSRIATGSTTPHSPAVTPPAATGKAAGRATVLLVMVAGNRGIRRWNKTADPMLCIEGSCYISTGAGTPAHRVTRSKGFGPGIALGERAGACRSQLVCVFRDVEIGHATTWMQPIDLRVLRHDRREARRVSIDETCRIAHGKLSCRHAVDAGDYRAWIVPEGIAAQAGEQALKAALDARLATNLSALAPR